MGGSGSTNLIVAVVGVECAVVEDCFLFFLSQGPQELYEAPALSHARDRIRRHRNYRFHGDRSTFCHINNLW